jgi:hypothetical protein
VYPSVLRARVDAAMKMGDHAAAWELLLGAEELIFSSVEVAAQLLDLDDAAPDERAEPLFRRMLARWSGEWWLIHGAGARLLARIDGRQPDDDVPDDDPARPVIPAAEAALARLGGSQRRDPEVAGFLWTLLANACRHAGAEHDARAHAAYEEALRLERRPAWRFDLGLFYKQRRRWEEGVEVFEKLVRDGHRDEEFLWNAAICATGAGRGKVALRMWKELGMAGHLADDGLPHVEGLGDTKVRLSTPGPVHDHEHLWVRPQSPCHGALLNATMYEVGADIGDVVIWDGQPIGEWRYGDRHGHRFAALGVLARGEWRTYRFRGRSLSPPAVDEINGAMPGESGLYVFNTMVRNLCARCIREGGEHSAAHEEERVSEEVATGKLVVSPDARLDDVRLALERGMGRHRDVVVAVPAFYDALGDELAARRHAVRWDALLPST